MQLPGVLYLSVRFWTETKVKTRRKLVSTVRAHLQQEPESLSRTSVCGMWRDQRREAKTEHPSASVLRTMPRIIALTLPTLQRFSRFSSTSPSEAILAHPISNASECDTTPAAVDCRHS